MTNKLIESIESKLKLLKDLKNFNNNCNSFELLVKRNDSLINNNCVKMCKIKTECKSIDIYEQHLNPNILVHLNERQLICNNCNKSFTS